MPNSGSGTRLTARRLTQVVLLCLLMSAPASAVVFTVTSETDEPDVAVGDGVCQTVGGACTLRAALEEAAVSPVSEIAFAVENITLTANLPSISAPLTIGSCASPVHLSGDATLDWGLRVEGKGTHVRGIIASGFTKLGDHSLPATNGVGVRIDGDRNTVECSQLIDNTYGLLILGTRTVVRGVRASGNAEDGVLISGQRARHNRIVASVFGLTEDGTSAQPNGGDGVDISDGASANLVMDVIASGNSSAGIEVRAHAHHNRIIRATVGLDVSRTVAVGNRKVGVKFLSPRNDISWSLVSGQTIGAESVFSRAAGIEVEYPHNRVRHCLIGTSPDGLSAMPNAIGLALLTGHNIVTGNTVSANLYEGIVIAQDDDDDCAGDPDCRPTAGLWVARNRIGVGSDGITPLGNARAGIVVNGVAGSPGGTVNNRIFGNIIANSGASGISTYDYTGLGFGPGATGNAFYGNIMYNNAGTDGARGIDLTDAVAPTPSDGITPNHVGILSGPNNFQNHPDITAVVRRGDRLTAELTLNAAPLQSFIVEVCSNVAGDPECQWLVARKTVQTDATGRVAFTVTFPSNVPGSAIAATASRNLGAGEFETSEFSAEFPLP